MIWVLIKRNRLYLRVGKAMGPILPILDEFDEHINISIPSGAHKPLNILKDQQKISTEFSKHIWNSGRVNYANYAKRLICMPLCNSYTMVERDYR